MKYQISHDRIAFNGSLRAGRHDRGNQTNDLTIIDLNTGQIILSCLKDLGFPSVSNFLLQKENLIFEHLGEIVFAKFWV